MSLVDHVVVGGGVMGSAAAWQLARRGRDVVLLERFAPGHAHGASHGSGRIYRTTYTQAEYLDLAQEALPLWSAVADEADVAPVLKHTDGISHGPGLQDLADALAARRVAARLVDPAEAAERWPGLRFELPVLHESRTAGRLHADRAVEALQRAARRHGASVRHGEQVTALVPVPGGVLVRTATDELVARSVVVAVGAWTQRLLTAADGPDARDVSDGLPPLVVTQEQPAHVALRPHAPTPESWPVFTHQPRDLAGWPSGTYGLVDPVEGLKIGFHGVGPVTDPDRRTYRPEPGQLALLRDYVRAWVPGADPDHLVPVSCTYTTTPDHDFVLDRRGRVVVAAGFSGHGFKFAPAVGRVLADLAAEDPDIPSRAVAARFALHRLGTRAPA
ncbi:FAD-dependent oxidoreductase [Cellulomonas fimi]|uniref:FAD dependent oxidoreductase n=1 Tax=Cellulomonas fimi (strain ATCC 484 / DSM 20113 / JCM 1341 / CCUG 24087 / LMG 16345 / NBRC 15513 / NCIMB 8980 / NCTC 7547 / NRS-133) TaxID=590998 RepID=F4H3A9_CELFA|nr:FAD-dependent oxidoreductase [Cellulomonas fimi]AEE45330.1 FAD dependent oxidoreductase [Cellulomonas fimi ATCC 484]NNH07887.1 FAD-dependent oxidoreductase [Cellulomonas fimi]VEH28990.1 Monomeric sarcosine oxidase [Cellulomonas fimi]